MFRTISFSRTSKLIKLFKQHNYYYLSNITKGFIPATFNSTNFSRKYNYLEIQYLKPIVSIKNVDNVLNKYKIPFHQYRFYGYSSKQNQNIQSNADCNKVSKKGKSLTQQDESNLDIDSEIPKKISIFQKFKLMYKKYWYVLIPVHLVTSVGFFFGFYALSKSGVDITGFLEMLNVSESIINKVKGSNMGHYAIAYLCYKLITPLRYAVTLGGTTVSIRYLVRLGYIKPVPTKQEVYDKFKKAKADFTQRNMPNRKSKEPPN